MIVLWASSRKYSVKGLGLLLTKSVISPLPERRKTRAMDDFLFPVP